MIESTSASVFNIVGAGRGIGSTIVEELLAAGRGVLGAIRKPTGLSSTLVESSPKGLASLAVKALV